MPSSFSKSKLGLNEQEWIAMLNESPLFQAVNDIEKMIDQGIGPQSVLGATGRPYIDIKVRFAILVVLFKRKEFVLNFLFIYFLKRTLSGLVKAN